MLIVNVKDEFGFAKPFKADKKVTEGLYLAKKSKQIKANVESFDLTPPDNYKNTRVATRRNVAIVSHSSDYGNFQYLITKKLNTDTLHRFVSEDVSPLIRSAHKTIGFAFMPNFPRIEDDFPEAVEGDIDEEFEYEMAIEHMKDSLNLMIGQLMELAEKNTEGKDIHNGAGEIGVNNITYQIQVSFVADKEKWCPNGDIQYGK